MGSNPEMVGEEGGLEEASAEGASPAREAPRDTSAAASSKVTSKATSTEPERGWLPMRDALHWTVRPQLPAC